MEWLCTFAAFEALVLNTHNWFPHTSYKKWLILRRAKENWLFFACFYSRWTMNTLFDSQSYLQMRFCSYNLWFIFLYLLESYSVLSHCRIIKSNKILPFYPTWCMPGVSKCLINLEDQKQNCNLKIRHFEWSHLKQRLMEIDFYCIFIHLIIFCQSKPESWLTILCKHSLEVFSSCSSLHT